VTKACARCNLTNVNQETAEVGLEPIRTLARYRLRDKNIYFGQYLALVNGSSVLKIGDELNGKA